MTKIVYNACFGGFGLSDTAEKLYKKLNKGIAWDGGRADPILAKVVEILGEKANGDYAKLKIAEVPEGSRYRIDEYDGNESVMTPEDYEWEIA